MRKRARGREGGGGGGVSTWPNIGGGGSWRCKNEAGKPPPSISLSLWLSFSLQSPHRDLLSRLHCRPLPPSAYRCLALSTLTTHLLPLSLLSLPSFLPLSLCLSLPPSPLCPLCALWSQQGRAVSLSSLSPPSRLLSTCLPHCRTAGSSASI